MGLEHNFIRNNVELVFLENFLHLGKFNECCEKNVVFVVIFLVGLSLCFDS